MTELTDVDAKTEAEILADNDTDAATETATEAETDTEGSTKTGDVCTPVVRQSKHPISKNRCVSCPATVGVCVIPL